MMFSPTNQRRLARGIATIAISILILPPGALLTVPTAHATTAGIQLASPAANAVITGSIPLIASVADPATTASVQFLIDGIPIGAPVTALPYELTWNSNQTPNGSHGLVAELTDTASNILDSQTVSVSVSNAPAPDTTAPMVTVTAPGDNTILSGTTSVTASATDNLGVIGVQFTLDGASLGAEVTSAPFHLTWDTATTTDGAHTLAAIARDAAGNTATATDVHVQVHNAPPPPDAAAPTISFVKPTTGTIMTGIVPLTVHASDDIGVVGVQYQLDGLNLGPEVTSAPFSTTWDTSTTGDGSHALTAIARDAAGNSSTCDPANVTVNNTGVINTNGATVDNGGSATATTGSNAANGHDSPVPVSVSTGNANAGVTVPNTINTNVTNFATPGIDGTVTVDNANQASLDNTATTTADSGNNVANGNRFSDISTGNANTFTAMVNAVNTDLTGANFNNQNQNFFENYSGSIDLLTAFLSMLTQSTALPTNVQVNNVSSGTITNTVTVDANTGGNVASGTRQSRINTGDVNVGTNILNLLNTNIVGSNWLFSAMNFFGNLTGDIILPGEGVLADLTGVSATTVNVSNQNVADISNSLAVNGDTGSNVALNNRDGATINTGSVVLQNSVVNQVNTNVVGSNFFSFIPHLFGGWSGSVIDPGGSGYLNAGVDPSATLSVSNANDATINNAITVNASTGSNTANSNRFAAINTGDINVATNLINVANTNFVGSNWFLGNVNVFGAWQGNIVYAYPDLALGEFFPTTAQPGEQVTFTLHYTNLGLSPAGNVKLTDTLPPNANFVSASNGGVLANGTVTWNLGQLPKQNGDNTVSVTVQIPDGLTIGQPYTFTNQGHISTTTPEPTKSNNDTTSLTTVLLPAHPQLVVSKTNSATGPVAAGDQIAYTVNATNTGDVPLTNVDIHDRLPDQHGGVLFEKDFTLDSLAVGATMTATYTLTVSPTSGAGVYTNTASASAQFQGASVQSSTATSSVTVFTRPVPAPVVTPAAPPVTPPTIPLVTGRVLGAQKVNKPAALIITHTSSAKATMSQGDKINFRVATANPGSVPLTNVVLTSTLTNGKTNTLHWNIGKIGANEAVVLTYTLTLDKNATVGKYQSVAAATGKATDGHLVRSNNAPVQFVVRALHKGGNLILANARRASSSPLIKGRGSMRSSSNGGLLFFNDAGKGITAWAYAQLTGSSITSILSQSKDPTDVAFVKTYNSGMALVGKKGKNGKVITASQVLADLKASPQFSWIFGTTH